MWNLDVMNETDWAIEDEYYDAEHVLSKRYKTRRGALNFIDRFAMDLREYWVDSHTVTRDEIELRCWGMRDDDTEPQLYRLYATCL